MPEHSSGRYKRPNTTLSKAHLPRAADDSRSVTYTVKSGDTLSEIAERFHLTTRELLKRNKLDSHAPLKVGEKLSISGRAPAPKKPTSHDAPSGSVHEKSQGHRKQIKINGQRFDYCPELSQEFLKKVHKVAGLLQTRSEYLLGVMFHETSGTFAPNCKSESSSGIGLLQWTASGRECIGKTTGQLVSMTREQQLSYVYKYLKPYKGKLNSLDDLYMAIIRPASVGASPVAAVFQAGGSSYSANSSLDRNGDGTITKSEVALKVRASFQEAVRVYGRDLAQTKIHTRTA